MKQAIYTLILLAAATPLSADWTLPHGDARNSGVASANIGAAYHQLWEMPIRCVTEPPIIARGRVYVMTERRELEAVDCRDGVTRWRFPLTKNWKASREGFGGRILDAPPPAVMGDRVFGSVSTFFEGRFVALDAGTGALVWEHRSPFTAVGGVSTRGAVLSAPVFWRDRVVIRTQNGFTALRISDGKELWNVLIDREGFDVSALSAHPAVGGDVLYLGGDLGIAYAIRLRDGKRIWSFETLARERKRVPGLRQNQLVVGRCAPLLVGDQVFFSDGKGNVYALVAASGKKQWQLQCGNVWQLAAGGKALYVVASSGLIEVEAASGKIVRRYSPPGGIWSCTISSGRAVLSHDAETYPGIQVFDLRKWVTVWRDSSMGVRNGFAVSENSLFVAGYVGAPSRTGLRRMALRAYRTADTKP
jgi:outer membrane protein assembly factor BamB